MLTTHRVRQIINDKCKTIDVVGTPYGYEPNLKELTERVDRLGSDAMSDSIVRSEIDAQISKLQRMMRRKKFNMENNLQIFENPEFGKVRTFNINNEPWVVASDVCDILCLANYRNVTSRLDADEKAVHVVDTPGGKQSVTCVNESGLYHILMTVDPSKAKARGVSEEEVKKRHEQLHSFKRWITHDVLPSIRKNGGYITGQETMTPQELMAKALMVAQRTLEEREARIAGMTKQIEIMTPKASYYDAVLNSKSLVSITEIAKDYGMSGKAMNKLLHDKKIQYKVNDTWVLYEKYHDEGYTGTKTAVFGSSEGSSYSRESTYWTQKGRLFIYDVMKKDGKIPVMEQENQ